MAANVQTEAPVPISAEAVYNACVTGNVRGLPGWAAEGVLKARTRVNNLHTNPPWALDRRNAIGGRTLDSQNRDIPAECGYLANPKVEDYKEAYDRIDLARRANDIWPDKCWAAYPEVRETEGKEETEFEKAFKALERRTHAWHYLHRVDRLSGIGHYAIVLYGLSDLSGGEDFTKPAYRESLAGGPRGVGRPANPPPPPELLYLQVYDELHAEILKKESRKSSPRYGRPVTYKVHVDDPEDLPFTGTESADFEVHWTRALHVADNRECSDVYGTPRLRAVIDDLFDLRKVGGSSGEMFYKGGFPGMQFVIDPQYADATQFNEALVKEDLAAYHKGLQRYLTAVGGEYKSLAPNIADPSNHLEWIVKRISAEKDTPYRVFMGSEAAHLASTQDITSFKEAQSGRHSKYLTPLLCRPFIDDQLDLRTLRPRPASDYRLVWHDLQTLSEKEMAEVGLKRTQAIQQYVAGKGFLLVRPYHFLSYVLGFSDAEAKAIIAEYGSEDAMVAELKKSAEPPKAVGSAGAGRAGNAPAGANGRPPGRVEGQA